MYFKLLYPWLLVLLFQVTFAQKPGKQHDPLKNITILYTNDLHANLEPHIVSWISETRPVGGFANIVTFVKKEKQANPNALYFDAGDFFTGPNICSLTKGEAIIDLLNYLPIDATCIGNHEFDYGWQNMLTQFQKAKFPILNGNIFPENSNELLWNKPYLILQQNGLKIGVIGLHGKYAFYDTVAEIVRRGIEAKDEKVYLQKYIDLLKNKVDLIVLLIHEGIPGRQSSKGSSDVERNLQCDLNLAKDIKGIDILITGHAHQGTPKALNSNGTIIVSTDALGIEVGKLEIQYNQKQKRIVNYSNELNYLFDDEIEDDIQTSKAIDRWKTNLAEITNQKVSSIAEPLTRSYGDESLLGNMVADAMLSIFPDYDIAVVNSGGLREDVTGPNVSIGNLISAFPFPNTIVQCEIKGSVLKQLLEQSVGKTHGILQVSKGTTIEYNNTLPTGNQIVHCLIKGNPLNEDSVYKILTNNFLAEGGDSFTSFKNVDHKIDTNIEIVQSMIQYMKTFDLYKPKLEGRVVNIGK
ncbi:MAG TPA: bifunctional UDP-sugar hydrolase/5'-nucleotidase [Prolixibacteraceae bacterium]|nr:bifunctional UDP-sugar hydrolase/5'-nucleotidase [Prolixibacteraceae bacterium]